MTSLINDIKSFSPRCADDNLGVTDKNSKLDNPLFSIKTTNREIEEFFDDSEKVQLWPLKIRMCT